MFQKISPVLSVVVFLTSLAAFAHSDRTRIELTDRLVEGLIDHPEGEGPHPLLILAAGAESDLQNRLYEKLVAGAIADGFVTYRLDWSFKKKKGAASADLKREAEELGVVVTQIVGSRMMKQYEVDTAKVALVAVGLGAKVAMQPDSGGSGEKIKATLLMNPPCEKTVGSFATAYAPFIALKSPRMIAASRAGGCPLSQIYGSAKDFGDEVSLFTTDGDALFAVGKNLANQDAAIAASLNWLRAQGWSVAKRKIDAGKHIHEAQTAGTHP